MPRLIEQLDADDIAFMAWLAILMSGRHAWDESLMAKRAFAVTDAFLKEREARASAASQPATDALMEEGNHGSITLG